MSFSKLLLSGGWTTPSLRADKVVRRYSTTGDILSFKRCRRQYGFFHARKFASATATQYYFGTLVHDVMDKIYREYKRTPVLPTKAQVGAWVDEAHNLLTLAGIRTLDPVAQKAHAVKVIDRFIQLVGKSFLSHIVQTEYRLERPLAPSSGDPYVLDGIVDVLAGSVSHDLGLPFATNSNDIEIWDYKAGKLPRKGDPTLQNYEYQMRVYSELYRQQAGSYPARAVLVFMGELDNDATWDFAGGDPTRFPSLFYIVPAHTRDIDIAMNDFHQTVADIEAERAKPFASQWEVPLHAVDPDTCAACEIRFNCAKVADAGRQRSEPL